MNQKFKKFMRFASRADIFFYALIWLIVLLVIGTVQQKYIGLYLAQKIYFSSYLVWIGDMIPVPGGYTILAVIFLNLLAKLCVEKWTKAKLGTVVIHCGAILLLFGGFFTAAFSSEGNMIIQEGGRANFVADYHARELVAVNLSSENYDEVTAFGPALLKPGKQLQSPSIPFDITVKRFCRNCSIVQRETASSDPKSKGMLIMNDLQSAKPFKEDEKNRSGVIIEVSGSDGDDGQYALFEFMPVPQYIVAGKQRFLLDIRRQRTYLPFEIELIDFQKEVYPGTNKARSYQSEVILREGDLEWHSLIYMNNPLRYRGYTFYQSSFIEEEGMQITVLAAVKNIGKIFPYISSIIICIGLLIHMVVYIPKLAARREKA